MLVTSTKEKRDSVCGWTDLVIYPSAAVALVPSAVDIADGLSVVLVVVAVVVVPSV